MYKVNNNDARYVQTVLENWLEYAYDMRAESTCEDPWTRSIHRLLRSIKIMKGADVDDRKLQAPVLGGKGRKRLDRASRTGKKRHAK